MATLKEQIQQDLKLAMKARDQRRVGAIRLMTAALKQKEIDDRIILNDEHVLVILNKLAKQRKESIHQYRQAMREDLIDQENYELNIIQHYLPQPMDDDEVVSLIEASINDSGAQTIRDMGKVMATLKEKLQGRADMTKVSALVKEKLT